MESPQAEGEPFGFFKHLADDELSIFCPGPRISSYLSGQHGPVSTRKAPHVDVGA